MCTDTSKWICNEKWQAVVNCDKNYDGQFFYGVKSTGIFCRPSCKAKTPDRKNVLFFDNPREAKHAGFRPCKRCRPDIELFEPDLDLIQKVKGILNENYSEDINFNNISKQLGVSPNHMARLFKSHIGLTPTQYITKLRIDKSLEMLKNGNLNVLDIAQTVGFKSLSNFYKSFKLQTGQTPNEYRKNNKPRVY